MSKEGNILSRLSIETPGRAQMVLGGLNRDMERRINASPHGLCPVDMSLNYLRLCHAQTCGKCVPCRVGLSQLTVLIEQVLDRTATVETIDLIERTAQVIADSADCAIGYEAAHMVLKGEVPIEEDGSVNFMVPAGKHVYFQLLDKDKKMIQSMRSGVSLMPGEVNGCVGCHEDRISILMPTPKRPIALTKKPVELEKFMGMEPFKFSFMEHVQPIMDRRCVKCHDFDKKDRQKVVLAKDMNQFFNAAYINLYVNKVVGLIGGGPADIQQPYSWGSHNSRLSQIIEGDHHGVKLTQKEKEWLYAWMDLNGVYYPVYESAFDNTLSGRSPLTYAEIDCLSELTGVNLRSLNTHTRTLQAQISFDRPAESPILDGIRNDKSKYDVALALIELGSERLKNTPRGDIERDLVPCQRHEAMLKKYDERIQNHKEVNNAISSGGKIYDRDQQ